MSLQTVLDGCHSLMKMKAWEGESSPYKKRIKQKLLRKTDNNKWQFTEAFSPAFCLKLNKYLYSARPY